MLDVDFVRSRFPGLHGDDWAFMDNAGGTFPAAGVVRRMTRHLELWPVQLGASYPRSAEAAENVAAGRHAAATLMNADPDEVILGPSTTMNLKLLAEAIRPLLEPGDEVVVTNLDHEANIGPWRECEAEGITVREWSFDPDTLELDSDGLAPLLNERTRLVCFTHCSNLFGSLHDAKALIARIHEAGALAVVDGVAFAPHRRVDVKDLGVDAYALSLYKVFGPHIGLLYVRRDLLERCRSRNHFFLEGGDLHGKLEPGNVNYELTAAIPGIREYLDEIGDGLDQVFGRIAEYEEALVAPLLEFLASRDDVRILGRADGDRSRRVPTVSFVVRGRPSSDVPPLLEEDRIAIRYGHFYAYRAAEALDLDLKNGVVRVSLVHYNTLGEVERLIAALERIL